MAPFLSCSVYPAGPNQPTEFEVYMDGAITPSITPALAVTGGVRLNYDLASISIGNHTVTVKGAKSDPYWGRITSSSSSPFAFVRPSGISTPIGINIVP